MCEGALILPRSQDRPQPSGPPSQAADLLSEVQARGLLPSKAVPGNVVARCYESVQVSHSLTSEPLSVSTSSGAQGRPQVAT